MEMNVGNLFFMAEILIAELIFLYPVPKRSHFWFRLVPALILSLLAAAFLPGFGFIGIRELSSLLRFLVQFVISVLAMGFCFRLKPIMLISMCVAGYAVQHLSYRAAGIVQRLLPLELPHSLWGYRFYEITVMPAVYLIIFLTFGRFSARNECYKNNDRRLLLVSLVTVAICVGMNRLSGLFGETRSTLTSNCYGILCCLLALFVQFNLHRLSLAEKEAQAIELVRREEKKQYEITKNSMDSINIKLHDLKHKLSAYNDRLPAEEVESLHRDINIYDSYIKTGNDAMDVLLSEKMMLCSMKKIRLTFSGDCTPLSGMRTMDIYSLFGNAIDNAIEAVENLEEDKRIIDVTLEEKGDLVFVGFTNYYEGELIMEDGMPATTKKTEPGYHGYGMKSMKLIAAKYQGELTFSASMGLFNLSVYLKLK